MRVGHGGDLPSFEVGGTSSNFRNLVMSVKSAGGAPLYGVRGNLGRQGFTHAALSGIAKSPLFREDIG